MGTWCQKFMLVNFNRFSGGITVCDYERHPNYAAPALISCKACADLKGIRQQ